MTVDLTKIDTEKQNSKTMTIDTLSTIDMVRLINQEDQAVIAAIEAEVGHIAQAVDAVFETIQAKGRLVYIGAGTSGRLGVLDASEVLPTFGVGQEGVIGLIAGGDRALRHPVEAAEDDEMAVVKDLKAIHFNEADILCAIAASGRTPYCMGGLKYAQQLGAKTIALTCVTKSAMAPLADIAIEAAVGQEVVTGSTRMKSGSATKMILNMISTGAMIKLGKVYGNLMVDVKTSNAKLIERARGIVMNAAKVDYERAVALLEASGQNVKLAIVMHLTNTSQDVALKLLEKYHGKIAEVIKATT